MIKPISPRQVQVKKNTSFPDFVIEAFNDMIAEQWDGREAVIKQLDVTTRIMTLSQAKMPGLTRQQIYSKGWLDIEDLYRKRGWIVIYEKGDYTSSEHCFFTFKKRTKGKKI